MFFFASLNFFKTFLDGHGVQLVYHVSLKQWIKLFRQLQKRTCLGQNYPVENELSNSLFCFCKCCGASYMLYTLCSTFYFETFLNISSNKYYSNERIIINAFSAGVSLSPRHSLIWIKGPTRSSCENKNWITIYIQQFHLG